MNTTEEESIGPLPAECYTKQHGMLIGHRKRTTYKNPSLLTSIETSSTIEQVGVMRSLLMLGIQSGQIVANRKTIIKWEQALWSKIIALLFTAKTGNSLVYIKNYIVRWNRPSLQTDDMIEQAFALRAKLLPNPYRYISP